jgi:hypothetical protein
MSFSKFGGEDGINREVSLRWPLLNKLSCDVRLVFLVLVL